MELRISREAGLSPDSRAVEVVERKGLGHPDTICDAPAERLGGAPGRFDRDRFGLVLHDHVDKALLWTGACPSRPPRAGVRIAGRGNRPRRAGTPGRSGP